MMRAWLLAIGLLFSIQTAFAEPLVRLSEQGEPQAALATGWQQPQENTLVFELPESWLEKAREQLSDKLRGATLQRLDATHLQISGLPQQELFSRLAEIEITEKSVVDPFAEVADTAPTELIAPDGASSVRVAQPTRLHDPVSRQFTARVIRIKPEGAFPFARVRVKLLSPPVVTIQNISGQPGDEWLLRPFFALKRQTDDPQLGDIDLDCPRSRLNIGTAFLRPGDLVIGEVSGASSGGIIQVLYLQRQPGEKD